tara:strand:+ start:177 stop:707 length:531 start_codon:yes stop_codon:yes gene_type:complete
MWRGRPCDDTEVRNYAGLPAWKNYGEWLSECDSLADAWEDSTFAIVLAEKAKEQARLDSLEKIEIANMDLDLELDLDAMWDNTVWNEITDIGEEYVGEVEQITAVAGVRGAEAEDEALHHLYYRRTMKGISQADYRKAYGKLRNTRDKLFKKNPEHPKLERMNLLLRELENKIKNV